MALHVSIFDKDNQSQQLEVHLTYRFPKLLTFTWLSIFVAGEWLRVIQKVSKSISFPQIVFIALINLCVTDSEFNSYQFQKCNVRKLYRGSRKAREQSRQLFPSVISGINFFFSALFSVTMHGGFQGIQNVSRIQQFNQGCDLATHTIHNLCYLC